MPQEWLICLMVNHGGPFAKGHQMGKRGIFIRARNVPSHFNLWDNYETYETGASISRKWRRKTRHKPVKPITIKLENDRQNAQHLQNKTLAIFHLAHPVSPVNPFWVCSCSYLRLSASIGGKIGSWSYPRLSAFIPFQCPSSKRVADQ